MPLGKKLGVILIFSNEMSNYDFKANLYSKRTYISETRVTDQRRTLGPTLDSVQRLVHTVVMVLSFVTKTTDVSAALRGDYLSCKLCNIAVR